MAESQKPEPKAPPKPGRFPFMMRTRMMGVHGLGAASIGWVMAGCIAFGFAVGSLLDKHFGTSIWLPVMVMVGIAAGFREMFQTLKSLNREEARRRAEKAASRNSSGAATAKPGPSSSGQTQMTASNEADIINGAGQQESRKRIFEVPPPPLPSYMGGSVDEQKSDQVPIEDEEDLIARLLGKDAADELKDRDPAEGSDEAHGK